MAGAEKWRRKGSKMGILRKIGNAGGGRVEYGFLG
jgi:hypothetical protein